MSAKVCATSKVCSSMPSCRATWEAEKSPRTRDPPSSATVRCCRRTAFSVATMWPTRICATSRRARASRRAAGVMMSRTCTSACVTPRACMNCMGFTPRRSVAVMMPTTEDWASSTKRSRTPRRIITACALSIGSSGEVVAAETSRRSVITEKAGSSRVTRPGAFGCAMRAPGLSGARVSAAYSRMAVSCSAGELGAAAEMPLGLLGLAELLHQRRERHVPVVGGLEREARLDVALRLPPEALAHAELSQREKEGGVARVGAKPFLRALDLGQHLRPRRLAVEGDQGRVPVALERLLDDRLGGPGAAERQVVARRGGRDRAVRAHLGGELLPVGLERGGVRRLAAEVPQVGRAPGRGGFLGTQPAQLHEGGNGREDLVPVPHGLLGLQLQAQEAQVPRVARGEVLQHRERLAVAALRDEEVRERREARLVDGGRGALRVVEEMLALGEAAQLVGASRG